MTYPCADADHAYARAGAAQRSLLGTLADLERIVAEVDESMPYYDGDLRIPARGATERVAMALGDLRVAESYLGALVTARRERREADRKAATAECEYPVSVAEVLDPPTG